MSGTAIDFSAATRQISQSMERAMTHLTETVEMDLAMLEKRRIEAMSEMETSQLNDFFQGRNEEVTLDAVTQFEDRWVDRMAEKNGRLSDKDMLEMRREKQAVEKIIQRNNATLQQVQAMQGVLRSPQGSIYDGEYAREALDRYAKTGELPSQDELGVSPQNPFLKMRVINTDEFLRRQRRPEVLSDETTSVVTDSGLGYEQTIKYASDEDRARHILSLMRENPQFALSIQAEYMDLSREEYERINEEADYEGMNPQDYYALTKSEMLWPDRRNFRVDTPSARREHSPPPQRPTPRDPKDLSNTPPRSLIIGGTEVGQGFDLAPANQRISVNLSNARDVATNEIHNPGTVQGTVTGFVPSTNKIYVKVRVSDYSKPVTNDAGEPLFEAVRSDTGRSPIRGTREEIQAQIAEREERGVTYAAPTPITETQRSADVEYELDADEYGHLLEGITLPQRAQAAQPVRQGGGRRPY